MGWLVYLIGVAVTVIPMWRLCEREGYNPLWSLVCIVPLGLVVLLWVLAFRSGPRGVA